ncbi:MAG: TRAP transporter substrate-binding protein DctP [Alkalispirochaeta sp.]
MGFFCPTPHRHGTSVQRALSVPRFLLVVTTLLVFSAEILPAEETISFRISLENSADHVQTQGVLRFADALRQRSAGRIRAEVHHSSQLFRDQDVFRALGQGRVEMAVPGTWQIGRYEPGFAAFLLPTFFGRDTEFVHRFSDGAMGEVLTERIETVLDVAVPGRWYDLGPAHLYFLDRTVSRHEQLQGLTIRVAGGLGNELRIAALGAQPISIAWGDLPAHLSSGNVHGVLTSHETVRSGELWRYGVSHCLEDYQYFPQYVPIIRRPFWDALSPADRQIFVDAWEATVDEQRKAAAAAQAEARAILTAHDITITRLAEEQLREIRTELARRENEIARQLGVPPEILEYFREKE